MTLSDYRNTYSWQAAIDLGRPLTKLSEELPAQEQQGLIMALQTIMIELPATIASDLLDGSKLRLGVVVRLQTALELIERVYPALDTAEPKRMLDELLVRTESDKFAEVRIAPAPPQEEVEIDHDESPIEEAPAVEAPAESV